MGINSISSTKGCRSHSVTLEKSSQSYTEGEDAYSVTLSEDSLCSTAGKDSIAVVLGRRSLVKAKSGYIIIIEYGKYGDIKAIHVAKVGDKILDVTIEPNKWYGFDDEGEFRMFTEEEVNLFKKDLNMIKEKEE